MAVRTTSDNKPSQLCRELFTINEDAERTSGGKSGMRSISSNAPTSLKRKSTVNHSEEAKDVVSDLKAIGTKNMCLYSVPVHSLPSQATGCDQKKNNIATVLSLSGHKVDSRYDSSPRPPIEHSSLKPRQMSAVYPTSRRSSIKLTLSSRPASAKPVLTQQANVFRAAKSSRAGQPIDTIQEESGETNEEHQAADKDPDKPIPGGALPNSVLMTMLTFREKQIGSFRPNAVASSNVSAESNLYALHELRNPDVSTSGRDIRPCKVRPTKSVDLTPTPLKQAPICDHAFTRSLRKIDLDLMIKKIDTAEKPKDI